MLRLFVHSLMVGLFVSCLLCRGFRVLFTNGGVICVRFIILGVFVSHSLMVGLFLSGLSCRGFRVPLTNGGVICVRFIMSGFSCPTH